MKNFIYEEEITFFDKGFFQDNDPHLYDCKCYDGYAICSAIEDEEKHQRVKVTYPLREEVLANEQMCKEVLEYRGLADLTKSDIHYGDIMLAYGKVSSDI